MTVPTDDISDKVVDLPAIFQSLSDLSSSQRVKTAMHVASQMLEYAAYEMAQDATPDDVADVILMAAQLDRSAQQFKNDQMFNTARTLWREGEL